MVMQIKHLVLNISKMPLGGGGGGYSLIWPIRRCAAGQGMVFVLSVLNKVYNFAPVCPVCPELVCMICASLFQLLTGGFMHDRFSS